MHVHSTRQRARFVTPNIAQQFIPRKGDPLVFGEITEQVEFPGGKIHWFVLPSHLGLANVQNDGAELVCSYSGGCDGFRLARNATQKRFNSRYQFKCIERLGNIVVRAQFEAYYLFDGLLQRS